MEVDEQDACPSLSSGHSEQLQPSFFCCGKKIFTLRFFMCPFEEHGGSGWKTMVAAETCRETTHYFCEHQQTGHQLRKALAWSYQARALSHVLCEMCDTESTREMSQV